MEIILNNNKESIPRDSVTVSELLEIKKFTFKMILVKVNDKIVKKEDYPNTVIHHGDNVTVLHLMSGG